MRYTVWLNVLAGLHLGAAVCLVLMCIGTGDREVALLYLAFAFATAVIAYGFWFRRPWIRAGVVLVYGVPVLGLPILMLSIICTAKGDGAGFAILFAIYVAFFWAGIIPIAALMLWSLYGRRGRQVLGEINAVRFGLRDVSVLLLLCALILGGIAQVFVHQSRL